MAALRRSKSFGVGGGQKRRQREGIHAGHMQTEIVPPALRLDGLIKSSIAGQNQRTVGGCPAYLGWVELAAARVGAHVVVRGDQLIQYAEGRFLVHRCEARCQRGEQANPLLRGEQRDILGG